MSPCATKDMNVGKWREIQCPLEHCSREDCAVDFVEMGFLFFGVHLGKKKLGR